jgi:hypothetical protein
MASVVLVEGRPLYVGESIRQIIEPIRRRLDERARGS